MTTAGDMRIALAHWIGVAADLREENERLQRERNSLLAALQFALPCIEEYVDDLPPHDDGGYAKRCIRAVTLARDAIAKARGQK